MFFIPLRERACACVCMRMSMCVCACVCVCVLVVWGEQECARCPESSTDQKTFLVEKKITFSDCYQELGFFSWKCFSIKQMRSKKSFEQLFDFFHQVFNLAGCCNKKAKEASHNRKCQGQLEAYCPKMSFGLPATHQWSHFQLTNFQQTLFQRTHFQLTLFKAAWALYAIFSFSDVPELLIW